VSNNPKYIMKKKSILLVIGGVIAISSYLSSLNKQEILHDLTFLNVEALAHNEGVSNILCVGSGSLDCDGHKAEIIIENYSLK